MTSPASGASRLLDQLRVRAPRWIDSPGPVELEVVDSRQRTYSDLHHVRVTGPDRHLDVMVKASSSIGSVPDPRAARPERPERPALNPTLGAPLSIDHAAGALRLVEEAFARDGDDRIAALHVVDHLPAVPALVIEWYDEPSLRERSPRMARRSPTAQLLDAYRDTGRWLRVYHGIDLTDRPVLRATPAEAVAAVRELTAWISTRTGDISWTRAGDEAAALAGDALPDPLPIGLRHDDCAPRNFLVSGAGRVVGVDVSARWRAPVFEDLGHFAMAVESGPLAMLTRGHLPPPEVRRQVLEAFLGGYFGDEIPWAPVRWYELMMLLDRWAAWLVDGVGHPSRVARLQGISRRVAGRVGVPRRVRHLLALVAEGR